MKIQCVKIRNIYLIIFLFVGSVMSAQNVSTYFTSSTEKITDAMVFDANGNLYGSDFNGNSVYKVTPFGVVTTFVTGLSNPNGLAFDASGNLFVVEYNNAQIHKYDASGNLLQSYSVGNFPSGLIKDVNSNDMIFTLTSNSSINRLSPIGVVTPIYQGTPLNSPVGLAFDDNGELFVGNFVGRSIYKIVSGIPQFVATVPDGGAANNPFLGFITYGNNTIYGTTFGGHKIYEVNPNDTNNVQLFSGAGMGNTDGPIANATFSFPNGIIFNVSDNALYISQFDVAGNVRKIDNLPLTVENINQFSSLDFKISPNPVSTNLNIESEIFKSSNNKNLVISIQDITGKEMLVKSVSNESNIDFKTTINVSNYKSGIYFVKLTNEVGGSVVKKMMKK